MNYKFECLTEDITVNLGKALARMAKKGDIFLLQGTLGMGKTVLARAFIQELTNAEEVPSPTFTLLQSYSGKASDVYHFDLYRIKKPIEIFEIGIEEAIYNGISLIEWPEQMGNFRPRDAFNINIVPNPEKGKGRVVEISVISEEKNSRLSTIEV